MDTKSIPFSSGFQTAINSTLRVPALNSTDCDFTYVIPNFPQQNKFNRVTVVDLVVPSAWYLVNNGVNTFTLTEGASSTTVTIPQGNYTRPLFLPILGTLLTNASTSMGHTFVYTVAGPNIATTAETYVNTITVTGNLGVQPVITIPNNTPIGEILGLNQNSVNVFSGNQLVPPNIASFSVEWSVYLHSDVVALDGDDILCAIFNSAVGGNGTAVRYQAQHPLLSAKRYTPKPQGGFRFWLTDENNNLLSTHGLNVNFTLLFFKLEDPMYSLNQKLDSVIDLLKQINSQLPALKASQIQSPGEEEGKNRFTDLIYEQIREAQRQPQLPTVLDDYTIPEDDIGVANDQIENVLANPDILDNQKLE